MLKLNDPNDVELILTNSLIVSRDLLDLEPSNNQYEFSQCKDVTYILSAFCDKFKAKRTATQESFQRGKRCIEVWSFVLAHETFDFRMITL